MEDNNRGRGWHDEPERHAEAARERNKTNWLPLLAIPLALLIGWAGHDALNRDVEEAQEGQAISRSQQEYGVGGGPASTVPCED